MKVYEFDRIESKLQLRVRNSGERLVWFEFEGRFITRRQKSHGNKDLPSALIRQQLKLNENQFSDLIGCTFGYRDYVEILRNRGLI